MRRSDLKWTLVRPARLTDGPHTGRYRTAVDATCQVDGLSLVRTSPTSLSGTLMIIWSFVLRLASPTETMDRSAVNLPPRNYRLCLFSPL